MASEWYKHLATEYNGRYTHLYEQLKERMREGLGQPPQPLFQHIFENLNVARPRAPWCPPLPPLMNQFLYAFTCTSSNPMIFVNEPVHPGIDLTLML
ncbi:hypothetical protein Hdeb2414_s0006g00214591 [Helianthus debilis subsp. tardiflorus]